MPLIVSMLAAAGLGPAAAIALADSGGNAVGGATTTTTATTPAVTVTTPCSGTLGSTETTTGPATTTTVATTATVTTTSTETTPGTTTVTVTPACTTASPAPPTIAVPKSNPFNGRAMWIWELPSTNGGNVAAIIAQAKRYGIGTLLIKSSDGAGYWSQFSKSLVTDLHEAGLKVCAWQYVYGARPVVEANLGARAARAGANCLVIDAESEYQGRYPAAQTYMARLRKLIGKRFPIGLAGFPYVDYHLSFPYSVFLGPNGAQYNLPQMYWADIGTSVPIVFAHTYEYNEVYQRPIFPLGQLWGKLSAASIEQFNMLGKEYGASGVSWWDWQSASLAYFRDMTRTAPLLVSFVPKTAASVFRGNNGDLVIWAQEHLYTAGYHVAVDGQFGAQTQGAVRAFQRTHGLPATGVVDGRTWDVLDRYAPAAVRWTRKKGATVAIIARKGKALGRGGTVGDGRTVGGGGPLGGGGALVEQVPSWVAHVKSRNELHGEPGAGRPRSARR